MFRRSYTFQVTVLNRTLKDSLTLSADGSRAPLMCWKKQLGHPKTRGILLSEDHPNTSSFISGRLKARL